MEIKFTHLAVAGLGLAALYFWRKQKTSSDNQKTGADYTLAEPTLGGFNGGDYNASMYGTGYGAGGGQAAPAGGQSSGLLDRLPTLETSPPGDFLFSPYAKPKIQTEANPSDPPHQATPYENGSLGNVTYPPPRPNTGGTGLLNSGPYYSTQPHSDSAVGALPTREAPRTPLPVAPDPRRQSTGGLL